MMRHLFFNGSHVAAITQELCIKPCKHLLVVDHSPLLNWQLIGIYLPDMIITCDVNSCVYYIVIVAFKLMT